MSLENNIAVNTGLDNYIEYDDGTGNGDAVMEDFGGKTVPKNDSAFKIDTNIESSNRCDSHTVVLEEFEGISEDHRFNAANEDLGVNCFGIGSRDVGAEMCHENIDGSEDVVESIIFESGVMNNEFDQIFVAGGCEGDEEAFADGRDHPESGVILEKAVDDKTVGVRRSKRRTLAELKRKKEIKKRLKREIKKKLLKQKKTAIQTIDLNSDLEILSDDKNDKPKRFKCHLCFHTNKNEAKFHRHVQRHFVNDLNLCPCGIRFTTATDLVKHRLTGHNKRALSVDERADLKRRLMQAAKLSMDPLSTKKDGRNAVNERQRRAERANSRQYLKYKLKNASVKLENISKEVLGYLNKNNRRISVKVFEDLNRRSVNRLGVGKRVDLKKFFDTKNRFSKGHLKVCECGKKFTAVIKYNAHYKTEHTQALKKQKSDLTNMVYEAIKKASVLKDAESGKLQIFDPKMATLLKSGLLDGGLLVSGVKLATSDGKSIQIEFDGKDSANAVGSTESGPIFTYNSNVLIVKQIPYDNEFEYDTWNSRRFSFANTLKSTDCNLGNKILRLGQLRRLRGPVVQKPRIAPPVRNTVTVRREDSCSRSFPLKIYRAVDNTENGDERIIKAMCSLTRLSPTDVVKLMKRKHKRNSAVKRARPKLVIQRISSSEAERRRMSLKMSHFMQNVPNESTRINIIDSSQILYDAFNQQYILVQQV